MKKKITLITGGTGSGKTTHALLLANKYNSKAFIATAEITDNEMKQKIENHKRERDNTYNTYEEPVEIPKVINSIKTEEIIIVDCITFWVNNLIYYKKDFDAYLLELTDVLTNIKKEIIFVTNEVNTGVISEYKETREYVKKVSLINKKIAKLADSVYLMISGIPVKIK